MRPTEWQSLDTEESAVEEVGEIGWKSTCIACTRCWVKFPASHLHPPTHKFTAHKLYDYTLWLHWFCRLLLFYLLLPQLTSKGSPIAKPRKRRKSEHNLSYWILRAYYCMCTVGTTGKEHMLQCAPEVTEWLCEMSLSFHGYMGAGGVTSHWWPPP